MKDATAKEENAKITLNGKDTDSTTKSVLHEVNYVDIATHIFNIFKKYSFHITGWMDLPDGYRYNRIFNVGGGNCFSTASAKDWTSLKYLSITYN